MNLIVLIYKEIYLDMRKSLITPLLFAVILFLIIRLANDVPMKANYFLHSWTFIATELLGVVAGSFLCHNLIWKWIGFSIQKHVNPLIEYGVVLSVPALLAITVMSLSHERPLMNELTEVVIPILITVLMSIWMYLTMKNQYISKLYAESQIQLLRAQFHPHFLFNMLNTVYFTIDENNYKARETIENLSNLLRLQLYEGNGTIVLEKELTALTSYMELCKVRFGDSLQIVDVFDVKNNFEEIQPHLLLPLVENAVKHSGGHPRRVMVRLIGNGKLLELSVVNTVDGRKIASKDESGLGLTNLRTRLELLYPKKFQLSTERTETEFIANLKLELS